MQRMNSPLLVLTFALGACLCCSNSTAAESAKENNAPLNTLAAQKEVLRLATLTGPQSDISQMRKKMFVDAGHAAENLDLPKVREAVSKYCADTLEKTPPEKRGFLLRQWFYEYGLTYEDIESHWRAHFDQFQTSAQRWLTETEEDRPALERDILAVPTTTRDVEWLAEKSRKEASLAPLIKMVLRSESSLAGVRCLIDFYKRSKTTEAKADWLTILRNRPYIPLASLKSLFAEAPDDEMREVIGTFIGALCAQMQDNTGMILDIARHSDPATQQALAKTLGQTPGPLAIRVLRIMIKESKDSKLTATIAGCLASKAYIADIQKDIVTLLKGAADDDVGLAIARSLCIGTASGDEDQSNRSAFCKEITDIANNMKNEKVQQLLLAAVKRSQEAQATRDRLAAQHSSERMRIRIEGLKSYMQSAMQPGMGDAEKARMGEAVSALRELTEAGNQILSDTDKEEVRTLLNRWEQFNK